MPFAIIRNDITKMKTDVIVNAANTALQMGGGVCGSIFDAASAEKLQAACNALAPIQTGEAVITCSFNLPSKCIIHTAGPVYQDGQHGEAEQLYACYANSLQLAAEQGYQSIAFPLISSGIFGYPKEAALRVATEAIGDFLKNNDMDVYLVMFAQVAVTVSMQLLGDIESYIDAHYVEECLEARLRRRLLEVEQTIISQKEAAMHKPLAELSCHREESVYNKDLDKLVDRLDEPFNQVLMRLIAAKGKTETEVYKRANIDRRLFSKIKNGNGYMPGKRTVTALAVALELTLDETENLLRRAGFAFSHSQKFDVIIEYFIVNGKYDIFEINEVLFHYDQPLLGL